MRMPTPPEQRAIGVFLVIIIVLLVMALYGYLSGAWEPPPA